MLQSKSENLAHILGYQTGAVTTVMDDLGMDDKIIENLNLIKIWQHVLKGLFPRG